MFWRKEISGKRRGKAQTCVLMWWFSLPYLPFDRVPAKNEREKVYVTAVKKTENKEQVGVDHSAIGGRERKNCCILRESVTDTHTHAVSPLSHPSVVSGWPLQIGPAPSSQTSAAPRSPRPTRKWAWEHIIFCLWACPACDGACLCWYLSAHEGQSLLQLSQLCPLSLYLALSLPVDFSIIQDGGRAIGEALKWTGNTYSNFTAHTLTLITIQ